MLTNVPTNHSHDPASTISDRLMQPTRRHGNTPPAGAGRVSHDTVSRFVLGIQTLDAMAHASQRGRSPYELGPLYTSPEKLGARISCAAYTLDIWPALLLQKQVSVLGKKIDEAGAYPWATVGGFDVSTCSIPGILFYPFQSSSTSAVCEYTTHRRDRQLDSLRARRISSGPRGKASECACILKAS